MKSFAALGLSEPFLKSLKEQNYTKPFPIQKKAIPAILAKKDVLGIAQTGSGKTASYVLPILMNLQKKKLKRDRNANVLVLVPTRELAVQVKDVFYNFSKDLPQPIRTIAVFGGVSINPQMKNMLGVNVLVATPGRLIELVEKRAVDISRIDTLVLDEADKMLNLGFKDEVDQIIRKLPKRKQSLLFSATLSDDVNQINRLLLYKPQVIKIEPEVENLDLIQQKAYAVTDERKGPLLRYLIKEKNYQQVLVFASSVYKADNIADKLRKNGLSALAIHSKKSQSARTDALDQFKRNKVRVLVATDLLARGIDIEFLPCVINYELPRSPKDYVHRIGRTGRAENPGEAIALISEEEQHHFKVIQKKMKKQVEMEDTSELNLHGY